MKFFLSILILVIPALGLSQSWNYSYVDPCTKKVKTISVTDNQSVLVNYYGVVNTFNSSDFTNGNFENWILTTAAINSAKPCSEVTTVLTNTTNSTIVSNTINVVTNVMAITQMTSTLGSSLGTSMTSSAESINNSNNSSSGNKRETRNGTNSQGAGGSNSSSTGGQSTSGNSSQSSNNASPAGGSGSVTNNTAPTGNQSTQSPVTQNGNTQSQSGSQPGSNTGGGGNAGSGSNPLGNGSSATGNSQNSGNGSSNSGNLNLGNESQVSKSGSGTTANSVSNAIDGGGSSSGGSSGGNKSSSAKAQNGSLIASGDIVVISNTGETKQQVRFVGSITHSNTTNRRVAGALFTYTTGVNTGSLTLYKSFVSQQRKYNLVVANSSSINPEKDFFNTTTALETVKWKKFTVMGGVNFTIGNLGETGFMNLSTVLGAHGSFKVTPKVNTSILMMSIYSPFTQFYDGKWWSAGLLVVPFSSWDFKITKTFKYNISFTGVYELNKNFLNYQILTGGKINF